MPRDIVCGSALDEDTSKVELGMMGKPTICAALNARRGSREIELSSCSGILHLLSILALSFFDCRMIGNAFLFRIVCQTGYSLC